jgi:hypothetical protein
MAYRNAFLRANDRGAMDQSPSGLFVDPAKQFWSTKSDCLVELTMLNDSGR